MLLRGEMLCANVMSHAYIHGVLLRGEMTCDMRCFEQCDMTDRGASVG